jgi:hypothetical protein
MATSITANTTLAAASVVFAVIEVAIEAWHRH